MESDLMLTERLTRLGYFFAIYSSVSFANSMYIFCSQSLISPFIVFIPAGMGVNILEPLPTLELRNTALSLAALSTLFMLSSEYSALEAKP